jgi:RNA polymerase sigma-70 factor (ECF subfamily)
MANGGALSKGELHRDAPALAAAPSPTHLGAVPAERDTLSLALESVVARYGGVLRSIAARYRLSPHDREDLVQEVRVRLWRAVEGERMESIPASYLYRTASSAALDLIRRRRSAREDTVDDVGAAAPTLTDRALRPDQVAQLSDLAAQIERAIETIHAARRPVVRMYLAGYSSTEIGELMGWTEAKARNLLYRGLADLRERLTDVGLAPGRP